MSAIQIADTGLFVAIGRPSNPRFRAVRTGAIRNDIAFVLPEQVSDERAGGGDTVEIPPIDTAIEEGWAEVADSLDYTNSLVSRAMDGVRRYIANADGRPEDEIERADTALAGLAARALGGHEATNAFIYTTDIAAGRAVEVVLDSEDYGDSVTFVNAFRFIEELVD